MEPNMISFVYHKQYLVFATCVTGCIISVREHAKHLGRWLAARLIPVTSAYVDRVTLLILDLIIVYIGYIWDDL